MEILVNVFNQKLKIATNLKTIVEGSQQFVKFIFNLDEAWDGLSVFAQFRQGENAYNEYLDSDNSVFLPHEITEGSCILLLYGTGGNIIGTTNYVTLTINKNMIVADASSTEITQSLYQQLINKIDDMKAYVDDAIANIDIGEEITIDSSLSSTSTNPVQNKVINEALNSKQEKLVINVVSDYGADNTGNSDSTLAIHNALRAIKESGGVIVFPSGTYTISDNISNISGASVESGQEYLWIYSNTYIIGEGTVVLRPESSSSPKSFLRNYTSASVGGYNCTKNILIENIIFDRATKDGTEHNSGPLIGLGHAEHITMRNCTWRNLRASVNNCHQLEIVGCKDVNIVNCRFEKWYGGGNHCEALNIDRCTSGAYGSSAYFLYDNTANCNINIDNCYFEAYRYSDVPSGKALSPAIGNHYAATDSVVESAMNDGICVHGCTFYGDWNVVTSDRRDTITFGDGGKNFRIYDNDFIYISNNYSKGICINNVSKNYPALIYNNRFINASPDDVLNSSVSTSSVAYNIFVLSDGTLQSYSNISGSWKADIQQSSGGSSGGSSASGECHSPDYGVHYIYSGTLDDSSGDGASSSSISNINNYDSYIVIGDKCAGIGWRNGSEFRGGAVFGDFSGTQQRDCTWSFRGTINGTTLTLNDCSSIIHNPNGIHSAAYDRSISAIYGLSFPMSLWSGDVAASQSATVPVDTLQTYRFFLIRTSECNILASRDQLTLVGGGVFGDTSGSQERNRTLTFNGNISPGTLTISNNLPTLVHNANGSGAPTAHSGWSGSSRSVLAIYPIVPKALLWTGTLSSGGTIDESILCDYTVFLVRTSKGCALGYRHKLGSEDFYSLNGGGVFYDTDNVLKTISFCIRFTTGETSKSFIKILPHYANGQDVGNANHGSNTEISISEIYGIF